MGLFDKLSKVNSKEIEKELNECDGCRMVASMSLLVLGSILSTLVYAAPQNKNFRFKSNFAKYTYRIGGLITMCASSYTAFSCYEQIGFFSSNRKPEIYNISLQVDNIYDYFNYSRPKWTESIQNKYNHSDDKDE
ncbi:hypothetical protein A3Q56_06032 [Intoshia linei]|uniref:Uncharacterized protein n=1 Tax=Intoshia linei TaxID=1819745 RepID=A0A177AW73_9BILA|nr:hypothetical protein A3Q56_06032 [Intoshia linei]